MSIFTKDKTDVIQIMIRFVEAKNERLY